MYVNLMNISIILPARNEEASLSILLPDLAERFPTAEIIVVNDGSSDATVAVAAKEKAIVVRHPYSQGNGAAIKSGARNATGDILVFMDADSQHRPEDIPDCSQSWMTVTTWSSARAMELGKPVVIVVWQMPFITAWLHGWSGTRSRI